MPLHHGPAEGEEGMNPNIAELAQMHSRVGDDFWLRWDCLMSLNLDYATPLALRSQEHGPEWIEECLIPDDYWGYRDLKRAVPPGMPVRRASASPPGTACGCCSRWIALTSSSRTSDGAAAPNW